MVQMTSAFVEALCILTKPVGETHVSNAQSTQGALLCALQANLRMLEERLQAEPGWAELRALREQARQGADWCEETAEVTWRFTQECLLLLLSLARHLTLLLESFSPTLAPPNPRTPEAAPPLPPDVLSVSQQKAVTSALQFVVTLGLCPYLAPGVGVPLGRRSAFGAMVEGAVCQDSAPACERRLLATTSALLELAQLSSLATLIFTRHLGDVLAGLCQLGHRPHRPEGGSTESEKGISMEERLNCRKALQELLGKVYQPIIIKELLILQGGAKQAPPGSGGGVGPRQPLVQAPPWLRRLCGQLLSDRLMQPNGVQAVVRAVLEGSGAGPEVATTDWRKCDAVARILAACPQQSLSAEDYYSKVCPQVVELLHFRDKLTALQFQRVATSAVLTVAQQCPEHAQKHLLTPLFGPLARCGGATVGDREAPGPVQEWEVTRGVEDVYKVCVVGNRPCPALLKALGDSVPVLFSLYCFAKQGVCHLRAPCQEILLWYLSKTAPQEALSSLKQLCGLSGQVGGVVPGFHFSPGSDGGATLTPRDPVSDEDEALYEKVSGEQWRMECLVQLLAEIKDSDLPGDFFLELLKELTSWTAEQDEEDEEEGGVDTTAMTLLELEQFLLRRAERQGRRLALLQVLAFMCEGLSHSLLLRKPAQVVQFIVAMMERACTGLDRGSEAPVESQTLSMEMGLVATMMTGDVQLSAQDYASMALLLPPLDRISQQHPDPVIQELAADLRAAVATRGAFCPDSVTQAARSRSPKTTRRMSAAQTTRGTSAPRTTPNTPASQTTHNASPPERTKANVSSGRSDRPEEVLPGAGQSPVTAERHVTTTAGGASGGGTSDVGSRASEPPPASPTKAFSECLLEACDPDVPTRAVALRMLTRMLQERSTEARQAQERVLILFLENLAHEDTFVYLSAIQGLAVLADSFPDRVLQRLLQEYGGGATDHTPHRARPLETRLKVGEALMRASRAMGDLAPHHGRPLIGAFLQGVKDEDRTMRASSLSNLGELCQRLNFSLGPLAQELSCCLTALIKTEKEAEVRRAAVHVLVLLLRGLSDKTTQVLGDVLLDLYRALKWVVRSDTDDVAVTHAQLALVELDDVMKKFLFPQQKLEKKIVVLP